MSLVKIPPVKITTEAVRKYAYAKGCSSNYALEALKQERRAAIKRSLIELLKSDEELSLEDLREALLITLEQNL